MASISPPSSTTTTTKPWESMLPGPPGRNNGGASDITSSGLLAFASGSSISLIDTRSMQLISVIPLPPPSISLSYSSSSSSPPLSPFVTSVRWAPFSLRHFDVLSSDSLSSTSSSSSSSSHLLLAVGDRQGRLALLDFRSRSPVLWLDTDHNNNNSFKLGVQDICWVNSTFDTWAIGAITGPHLFCLFSASTGKCFFKYDAVSEFLSCVRRDPFDARHFVVLGLKGFLLSVRVNGELENDVVLEELLIRTDSSELVKLEKDLGVNSNPTAPASAIFPNYVAKCAFSLEWQHILFVSFPRELVVFDLHYETPLFAANLPRGGKFLDVLPDPNSELLYCVHLDGKLSTWRRREGEQAYSICTMQELMPSVGSSVPSPSILAAVICESDCALQNVGKIYSDVPHTPFSDEDYDNPFDFCDESLPASKTHLISISDDGKVWNWLLTAEGPEVAPKDVPKLKAPMIGNGSGNDASEGSLTSQRSERMKGRERSSNLTVFSEDISFKIILVGQLHLLSSTVTTLAVPSPSFTATLARGGNHPAVAVPLVALGTQTGTIEIVDVSANAVTGSFVVHSGVVRGLRWLGNSRMVSFSYTQANEKSGGYINRLIVTCVRSGFNRAFRVLQKPERAPIRALRASSSGRYLLILFRDAPVEVWAMTKNPIMLRSLALPFTVLEWTLPTVPRPSAPTRQSSISLKDRIVGTQTGTSTPTAPTDESSQDSKAASSEGSQDENSESFAFALVNGALGVFEVQGRRIKDFRPKWPSSSFVSSDGLITAMAYRLPHVVMGDRSGNIRWWDVTTGHTSSFNTHREGIRRIKFSPVVAGDRSRGRIAVLFYDNTFAVYDLDSSDPLVNSPLQPQFPGTLVLELDWLHLRTHNDDPLVLCIAGADSSFRLVEVAVNDQKVAYGAQYGAIKEKFRPMPLCAPILLPTPHALALRMVLQLGVKPSWFNTNSLTIDKRPHQISGTPKSAGDLRSYIIDAAPAGDAAVPEMLLKVLEPYRQEGCILDDERARLYAKILNKGFAVRLAFAAMVFGESSEALFWLQLPRALNHLINKSLIKQPQKKSVPDPVLEVDVLTEITSGGKTLPGSDRRESLSRGQLRLMAFEQEELWETANERILWHEKLNGEDAIQNRVHDLVSVGNLEAAVSLLLSTSPESHYFHANALRAVALASAVSKSLLELAVKVVAANMVRTDKSLSGTHLLCAVGRHQEACSQLQDAGCWTDAATLAATHLKGSDYSRVLHRWADHVLHSEHNLWRALILYVAAGAFREALTALREAQQPDTAAMFAVACREIHADILANREDSVQETELSTEGKLPVLPELSLENEEVIAAYELYGQYQRKLVHLCMDSQPISD
ncbi:uncharacterized protein LOC104902003 [Beta vulgaris subsp. vulgaris]|uniref:uncharacterized protein LOC104902003 n=1 Tax=Beta vulgaris subsp. vulgaris TaxID=3555 RepID=UPI002036F2E0|nr:uncharacterized protein LOC104902003 [Beta vulgaris subsp. vulgaris]